MGTILVTGATGNVGAEVARLLRERGAPPRIAARDRARAVAALGDGIAVAPFDFGHPETFPDALRGVERVFLVRPPDLADVGRFFAPFIAAMRGAGVAQVVFLSLLGAERLRVVPHRRIEEQLAGSGLGWTFLRASFFMQNLSTTHRDEIRERDEIAVPAGRGATSFVDVRDIAAVAAEALTTPGHVGRAYPLTGGEALDYFQVAAILGEVLGRPIAYTDPSLPRFLLDARRRRRSISLALVMAGIYTTARLGRAAQVTGDTARLLGRPPITVRQFASDYRACWARDE